MFWDNITHYKTKSVDFLGLMNSATKNIVFETRDIRASWCLGLGVFLTIRSLSPPCAVSPTP